jgi:hypothetical protein
MTTIIISNRQNYLIRAPYKGKLYKQWKDTYDRIQQGRRS